MRTAENIGAQPEPLSGSPRFKRCSGCDETKSLDEFYRSHKKTGAHGRQAWCKSCARTAQHKCYYKNPTAAYLRVRASRIKAQYGLTEEDYKRLLVLQAGVCAVCQTSCSTGKRLAVDHDHASGRIRGLLCTSCNNGLGRFKDDPKLLIRAADYLKAARKALGLTEII